LTENSDVIVTLIVGLAGSLIPGLYWLIYRLAVLRYLSRVYDKGGGCCVALCRVGAGEIVNPGWSNRHDELVEGSEDP
jgi:hypothetical protein